MKKICAIILAVICLLSVMGVALSVSAASSYIRGDVDGNGEVEIIDATLIQRKLGFLEPAVFDERAADVDGDGVDIKDVTWIQRHLAGSEDPYHIGETVTIPDPTTPKATDPYELPFIPKK
ncbi:MAG: dockerin type I repeat-containing protein [Ruminococcus sp.]|nr:dockerin type I repeat-containing protein [Ruminococcus sp.]